MPVSTATSICCNQVRMTFHLSVDCCPLVTCSRHSYLKHRQTTLKSDLHIYQKHYYYLIHLFVLLFSEILKMVHVGEMLTGQ